MSHLTNNTQETASIGAESCLLDEDELQELEPVSPSSHNGTYVPDHPLYESLSMSSIPEISTNNTCLQVPAPGTKWTGNRVKHVATV